MATLYIKELQEKGLNAIILYPTSVIGINDYKGSQAGKEIIKASKKHSCLMLKAAMILLMLLMFQMRLLKLRIAT